MIYTKQTFHNKDVFSGEYVGCVFYGNTSISCVEHCPANFENCTFRGESLSVWGQGFSFDSCGFNTETFEVECVSFKEDVDAVEKVVSEITALVIENPSISSLPNWISKGKKIKRLHMQFGAISRLTLRRMPSLEEVYASTNRIDEIQIGGLPRLKYLYLDGNDIKRFPLKELPSLKRLDLSENPCSFHHMDEVDDFYKDAEVIRYW